MAFYLALILTTATTKEKEETFATGTKLILFPCVYVTNILAPQADPSTYTRFPAKVDLINFHHITDKIATITFLVGDEEELDRLLLLAKAPKTKTIDKTIKIDISATEDFHKQIEYKYVGENGEMGPQLASLYPTIASYPLLSFESDWY